MATENDVTTVVDPKLQAPAPAQPTGAASSLRPRYVVRRGGGTSFEPMLVSTKAECEERLDREVIEGRVSEVDLYEYVGTVRLKRDSVMVNVFNEAEKE